MYFLKLIFEYDKTFFNRKSTKLVCWDYALMLLVALK